MNNNPRFDPSASSTSSKSPEAIRSEIDTTRRRMDDTIDALSSRLKGRHLVDEVLGFLRSSNGNGNGPSKAGQIGSKVADTASSAVHSVLDSVKAHPMPALLIGAGVAWMIYDSRRKSSSDLGYDPDAESYGAGETGWEDDVPYDYTEGEVSLGESGYTGELGATSSAAGMTGGTTYSDAEYNNPSTTGGKMQDMKDKLSERALSARDQLQQRTADLRTRGREQAQMMRERMQTGYVATRQRVATTVDSHPLESGLACLALGIVAGMLIPTPRAVGDLAGPTANRLGQRAREAGRQLVERGKHVAQAAAEAARREAESQGITPEALRAKATAVADRARTAATETAEKEGISPSSMGGQSSGSTGNQGGGASTSGTGTSGF